MTSSGRMIVLLLRNSHEIMLFGLSLSHLSNDSYRKSVEEVGLVSASAHASVLLFM